MDKYLVSLQGMGDTEIFFVDEDVYKWLCLESGLPERYHASFLAENAESYLTEGSTDGQLFSPDDPDVRAMMFSSCSREIVFYTISDAFSYFRENDINILGEFEGTLY